MTKWKKDWMPSWMDDHSAFEMVQELEKACFTMPKEPDTTVSPANRRKAAETVCREWEFDSDQTEKFVMEFTNQPCAS